VHIYIYIVVSMVRVKQNYFDAVKPIALQSFKTKATFGHNLRYKTKGTFGEISLKLCQTNWNVARINVNVVDDKLPSQSTNNLHLFND
jgi:hypothetical protein